MKFITKYFIVDNYMPELENPNFDNLIDEIFETLINYLNLISIKWKKINLIIQKKESQYYKNKIYVSLRNRNKPINEILNEFQKIFKHELTHCLIEKYYGSSPAIFWEGIPVFLADNEYFIKFKKFSYHEICKFLINTNNLFNLKCIQESQKYYGRRHDFRVDVVCASFVGFLIEKYGITNLQIFFKYYHKPVPENPISNINEALTKAYGNDINYLETVWHDYLLHDINENPKIFEMFHNKKFYKIIPMKNKHCKFCNFPLENKKIDLCPDCKADNKIKVKTL